MAHQYPRSVLTGNIAEAFRTVYDFHRRRRRGDTLDPTCGERIWWGRKTSPSGAERQQHTLAPSKLLHVPDNVLCSDAVKFRGCIQQDLFKIKEQRPEWEGGFSMVVYDPPYMINVKHSDDPREERYGGYNMTYSRLVKYMKATTDILPWVLRKGGKIIVKCSDQYIVKERTLHLWHIDWHDMIDVFFDIVDLFVYPYHRVSPTAYQVKDRPSSVISHTYFIVGEKR